MDIQLPVTWTVPGPALNDFVTVTFTEAKLVEGYHVRSIERIVWPPGFPKEQQAENEKRVYHLLNKERQKLVIDEVAEVATDASPQ